MTYVLSDYVNFKKLVCNKEYAKEKKLKVSIRKNLYVVKYDKSKINQENQYTLGLFLMQFQNICMRLHNGVAVIL